MTFRSPPCGPRVRALLCATTAAWLLVSSPAGAQGANTPAWGGADARAEAPAADIGLPDYPRAVPAPSAEGDKPAFSAGLWGGTFGFRIAVKKWVTDDPMAEVAHFYRRTLARRGGLRDCANPPADDTAERVSCKVDRPPAEGHLFKAGIDDDFNVVSLAPHPGGVLIQTVRVQIGRAAAR